MSNATPDLLLKTLYAIRDHAQYRRPENGLCVAVYRTAQCSDTLVYGDKPNSREVAEKLEWLAKRYMATWPERSPRLVYPVPSCDADLGPAQAYLKAKDLWDKDTAYGRKRWALLHYVIECVEQEINQQSAIKEK